MKTPQKADTKQHNIHVNMQAGAMLKDAGKNAKNGVYFVDSNNKAHKAVTLVDNKPARRIVIASALPRRIHPANHHAVQRR